MLVLDGSTQLNHALKNAGEAQRSQRLAELEQEIRSNTITVGEDNGRDRSNLLAQLGRPMTAAELMRRLKLCNPKLIFEQAIKQPRYGGIYVEVTEKSITGGWETRKVHVCGFEWGMMPEFSVIHKTTTRLPDPDLLGLDKPTREVKWKEVETFSDETRGWRTVLIRLLKANLIKKIDVEQHFGWTPSQESQQWNTFTQGA